MSKRVSYGQIAWTAGRLAGRGLLRAKVGAKDVELGELLTGQLDQMKGLGMKLGQIVSYMDVPLPLQVQQELERLQTGIVGMSDADTQAAFRSVWGEDFAMRFERLDLKPIAAASIGQVHRALYRGQEIALKLQYPQVAHHFESDLKAMNRLASLASLASAVDGKEIVGELAARLAEECDYTREASFQMLFKRAFASFAGVHIPEVIFDLSTPSTLATAWCDGMSFREAVKLPADTRNEMARQLVHFSYRSLLNLAAIQADPHPGNFLFGPNHLVTFLDFGCVRTFQVPFVETLRAMMLAVETGDRGAFAEAVIALGLAPRPKKFNFDHHFAMMSHLQRPLLEPSFTFTSEYVKEGLAYNGPKSPNARHMNMPPGYIWVARLQWGLWSLLNRLGATAQLRDLYDEVMNDPVTPLEVN